MDNHNVETDPLNFESSGQVLTDLQNCDLLVHSSQLSTSLDTLAFLPLSQTDFEFDVAKVTSYVRQWIHLPKDTFQNNLLTECHGHTAYLENVRSELLCQALKKDDFPFRNASLKKRLEPRSQNGDSLQVKLSRDCFELGMAVCGEYTDELKDVLSIPRQRLNTVLNGENVTNVQTDAGNSYLKDTLVRIEREINTLKGEHIQDCDSFNKRIAALEIENKTLRESNSKCMERLKNVQTQLNSVKQKQESQDKCNSNLSSSIVTLQTSSKTINSHIKEHTGSLTSLRNDIQSISKDSSDLQLEVENGTKESKQLKLGLEKVKTDISSLNRSTKDITASLKSEASRISNISDERHLGISNLRSKLNLANDKIKELEENINASKSDTSKFTSSISEMSKKVVSLERETRLISKTTASYAEVLKQNSSQNDNSSETVATNNPNATETLPRENVPGSDDKRPAPTYNNKNGDEDRPHTKRFNKQIPVHFPNSVCHPNSAFQGSNRRRISRFYVGGISKSSTEEGMRFHLSENNVKVTFLRFFNRERRSTSSAQLNVDACDEHLITHPKFWPPGIFVKPWLPWEVFKSEVQERQNRPYYG